MHDYRKLHLWNRARELAIATYSITKSLPDDERFGLQAQMRRSAVSIASNIAEGASRGTPAEFCRLLRIASGSASELETQLTIAADVGLLGVERVEPMLNDIRVARRMLIKLMLSLRHAG